MQPTTVFRAARPAFRASPNFFSSQAQAARSTRFQFAGRRFQSTAAPAAEGGWVTRLWNSPVGLKTVHFWAPVMKWSIVIAGISDLSRPAEKLSLTQNFALTCTGLIWTRWCFIIKPRNVFLATVNFFLGMVGIVQVGRIMNYRYGSESQKSVVEEIKEGANEVKKEVTEAVKA